MIRNSFIRSKWLNGIFLLFFRRKYIVFLLQVIAKNKFGLGQIIQLVQYAKSNLFIRFLHRAKVIEFSVVLLMFFLFIQKVSLAQIAQRGTATTSTTINTTLTISKPSGLSVDDLMIVQVVQSGNNGGVTAIGDAIGSGWTKITGSNIRSQDGNYYRATILHKISTAADVLATNFSFNLDSNSDNGEGAIIAFSGVDTNNPFDVTPSSNYNNIANDNMLDANSILVASNNSALIMFGALADDRNLSNWTVGLTELYDLPFNATRDIGMGAALQLNISAGPTGSKTARIGNSNNAYNGSVLIALKPFISASPPTCTSNISPSDGQIDFAVDGTLTWNTVSEATGYKIYFGTDANATNIENGTDLGNVTSYILSSNLDFLSDYYWKIVPYNNFGDANGCSVWSFTTEDISYCNTSFTNASFEWISNVTFESINNNSVGNAGGPVDYTSIVAQVERGSVYPISVTINADNSDYIYAFIDWDQDGDFNDADEVFTIASNTSSDGPHTLNINVPAGATLGSTRMRIMVDWNNSVPDPCRNASYGEVEDYTVTVLTPCNVIVQNVTGGGSYCFGDAGVEVALDNSETGVTYILYRDGISTTTSVAGSGSEITFGSQTIAGTYTVIGHNVAEDCDVNMNGSADISVNPLPIIMTIGTMDDVCFSDTEEQTSLEYTSIANSPVSYNIDWDSAANSAGLEDQSETAFAFNNGGGILSGIPITANTPDGVYHGTMTITNSDGCSQTQTVSVKINPLPNTSEINTD